MDMVSIKMTKNVINEPIQLDFHSIRYLVEDKKGKKSREILKNVSGSFLPGRICALLGPSGAGKTSLLSILAGFRTTGVKGEINVNGEPRCIDHFRKISAYIPQNFAMLEKLSVFETISISANLKIGNSSSEKIKQQIVNDVIHSLNLLKCANTRIEKLSGGEKKRLSIAIELVTNPPIMFFDEPTSGLDSVSSLQVISHLRHLAETGRTIICSIHQPSSKLLEFFDDLYILSDGQCLYNGTLSDMVPRFSAAGFHCPNYYNRADFALEVASLERGTNIDHLVNESLNIDTRISKTNDIENEQAPMIQKIGFNLKPIMPAKKKIIKSSTDYSISFWTQFTILTKRQFLCSSRDFLFTQLRFYGHILIGVLLGILFYDVANDATKAYTNGSYIFFVLMFLFFATALPTVLTVPLETSVFIREHLNNWYSVRAYFASKIIADLPLQVIGPISCVSISYFMTGQPMELFRLTAFYVICQTTTLLAQLFGSIIGAVFNMQMGMFMVPAICIPLLLFAGFFIKFNEILPILQPMTYISFFRYSFEGCIQSLYGFNREKLKCKEIFCLFKTPTHFLEHMDMLESRYYIDIIGIFIWIGILLIIFYITLKMLIIRSR